ncbi:MAG: hypothetical protein PHS54_00020 [Clostridia bacterium]|nr:hypothetical protein [Clostridia bacterium]
MAEQTTYGQFLSCTSLYDFQYNLNTYKKMNIKWDLSSHDFIKIELYRYIGPYMSCVNYNTLLDSTSPRLIYKLEQNFDTEGNINNTTTEEIYFPWSVQNILNENLADITPGFVDDYNALIPASYDLKTFHSLSENSDNRTIINDISFTRRVVYYILKTYVRGSAAPSIVTTQSDGIVDQGSYIIMTDNDSCYDKALINHSSKTQVRHDYLHYEGDEIWYAKIPHAKDHWLQQVVSDISPVYGNNSLSDHKGPTGLGGRVWSGNRCLGGIVYLHNLRDGSYVEKFDLTSSSDGKWNIGLGVHYSGQCLAIPGTNTNDALKVYKLDPISKTKQYFTIIDTNISPYIITLPGYNNKVFITTEASRHNGILNVDDNLTTGSFTATSTTGHQWYRAAACPNSLSVIAAKRTTTSDNECFFVKPTDASMVYKAVNTFSGMNRSVTQICVDNPFKYPNTILNTSNDNDHFCFRQGNEFGVYAPINATSDNIIINWSFPLSSTCLFNAPYSNVGVPTYYDDFCGFDSENNLWKLKATSFSAHIDGNVETIYFYRKTKVYRTADNWGDGIYDGSVYPYGGSSRYPSVDLDKQPVSLTNTKEIEWFLTRNHGVTTYRNDLVKSAGHSLQNIDASTLDNTVLVTWTDPVCGVMTETAYNSWWRLVERNMLRVNLANVAPTRKTEGFYSRWSLDLSYFKVYKSLNVIDGSARKWGIRMNVADIRAMQSVGKITQGENLDDFYDNLQNVWMPYIQARIIAWANAFTNTSAYNGVSEPTRTSLINGNKTGLLVHPFYQYAIATPINDGYVNPSLSDEAQLKIRSYMNSIKYYPFSCPISKESGDISVNNYNFSTQTTQTTSSSGTSSSTQLYKSLIHPSTTNPSIVLLLSGYQTNPGYQDTYAYCYPWKNTIPSTFNIMHTAISGYNNLNVMFLVSTNTGSYLPTAFKLYTDDYYPSYLTDTDNISAEYGYYNDTYNINNSYNKHIYFTYTYHSPTINGLYYLPSGNPEVYEYTSNNNEKPDGWFIPHAEINVINLYDYSFISCQTINATASAKISVFERWPEPRFYIDITDDATFRSNYFCNNTWGGSCLEKYSLQTENRPCTGFYGYTTWGRYVTSLGGNIVSTGDWFLLDDSNCSSIVNEISTIFGTCSTWLWEGYESFTRDISVTKNIPAVSVYGDWVSLGLSCMPPSITIYTTETACSGGEVGSMTISASVSTTYYTMSSFFGDWVLISDENCGKIECAESNCYTGSAIYL